MWIDGDGCPRAVKDIVFRAAERRGVDVVLVANRDVVVPRHKRISAVRVPSGLDVADAWLVTHSAPGDLVITSDTAIAHLAGALGVPVWLALSFIPDFRWLLDRSDSPWYPTMRLFRQKSRGDWAGVFGEIEAVLRERVAAAQPSP